jgi:hypothetical protein
VITNENDNAGLWYAIAFGVLLVAAAAIRFHALGTTFFEDEVWVADLIRHGGWHPHSYSTPPLFYAIGRAWSSLRGFSDQALREPAAFFGVALCAVPLFAPLPRFTRFAWAALLAFSSPLIFYSERLKQYTLEAFFATVLIVLFLRLRESQSALTIVIFFTASAAAVLTLYSPIFLLGAMAVISIRRPRLLTGFALVFALCGIAYLGWLKPGPESIRLHGDMTGFFTANGRWVTSPSLFVANTLHWMGQALNLIRFWWLAIGILVLVWIARERNAVLLLLAILPPLEVAAASVFRLYPYGEVRLMIVCFPALFLLIASSLAEAARRVPALMLLLAPIIFTGIGRDVYNDTYMHVYDLRPMFTMVAAGHHTGEAIYADPSFAAPLVYYYPGMTADIRWTVAGTTSLPGWYVQRAATFRATGSGTVLRSGDVIAVRSMGVNTP